MFIKFHKEMYWRPKLKRWKVYRVIVKQQAKREQTHPVCYNAVEKYKKGGDC